VALGMVDQYAR